MLRARTVSSSFAFSAALTWGAIALAPWALKATHERSGPRAHAEERSAEPAAAPPLETGHSRGAFLLEATSPAEARQVVRSSGAAGFEAAVELRQVALGSSDPLVAGNAVRALGRLGVVSGDVDLTRLLSDRRPRVRQEAVMALGASGDPRALDDLAPMLVAEDPSIRTLAIQAIGRIGGPRARELLTEACQDTDRTEVERVFLRNALTRLR